MGFGACCGCRVKWTAPQGITRYVFMLSDFYDIDTEPVIQLSAVYGEPKNILEKCIILFSKEIHDYLLCNYECKEIGFISACNGNITIFSFNMAGEDIAFYLSAIGSAAASQICYEVHWQTGAKKFVMFGSCGSLDHEKTDGKYIIPAQSYRGEGCSFYFAPASEYIGIPNCNKLAEIFTDLNVPHVRGRIWTTDSMLRETRGLVSKRRQEGCIAVEMEIAGVQAVCSFYGLELYCFLEAGDVLSDSNYRMEGLHEANHSVGKLLIALKVLRKI